MTRGPFLRVLVTALLIVACCPAGGCNGDGERTTITTAADSDSSLPTAVTSATPRARPTFDPRVVAPDPPEDRRVIDIAVGFGTSCAVLHDHSVWCWGSDAGGELGWDMPITTNVPSRPLPTRVHGIDDAVRVVIARSHGCALSAAGKARCWGVKRPEGNNYALGERVLARELPTGEVADLALGNEGAGCAVLMDGTLSCWRGVAGVEVPPTPVRDLKRVAEMKVDNGGWGSRDERVCLRIAGAVQCGLFSRGAIESGAPLSKLEKVDLDSEARVLSVAGARSCALLTDHTVACWWLGAPGLNKTVTVGLAQRLAVTDVEGVALGGGQLCVLKRDKTLWCRAKDQEAKQVAIAGVKKVAAAGHRCALDSDGVVHCWGRNGTGQLGNGSRKPQNEPAPISW